jgi:hypothetical protein
MKTNKPPNYLQVTFNIRQMLTFQFQKMLSHYLVLPFSPSSIHLYSFKNNTINTNSFLFLNNLFQTPYETSKTRFSRKIQVFHNYIHFASHTKKKGKKPCQPCFSKRINFMFTFLRKKKLKPAIHSTNTTM